MRTNEFDKYLRAMESPQEQEPSWLTETMQEVTGETAEPAWLQRAFALLAGEEPPESTTVESVTSAYDGSTQPDGQPWPTFIDSAEKRRNFVAEYRNVQGHTTPDRVPYHRETASGPVAIVSEQYRGDDESRRMMEFIAECHRQGRVAKCINGALEIHG